jgi:hypothetical protein
MTAQRVSRGFHRLGLFLAAIPFLIGGGIAISISMEQADSANRDHQKLACAHDYILTHDAQHSPSPPMSPDNPFGDLALPQIGGGPPAKKSGLLESIERFFNSPDEERLSLKQIGCSSGEYETVSYGETRNPPPFSWLHAFAWPAALGLGITFALTLAAYGLVRAIGWVIGGFVT